MGCCCEGRTTFPPDEPPVPPPLCRVNPSWIGAARRGSAAEGRSRLHDGDNWMAILAAGIPGVNDTAWSLFSASHWFQPPHTIIAEASSSAANIPPPNDFGLTIVEYSEIRSGMLIPLTSEEGGTQYSLRELYAISSAHIPLVFGVFGGDRGPIDPVSYHTVLSTVNAKWGLVDQEDVSGIVASGILPFTPSVLQSGISIPNANTTANVWLSGVYLLSLNALLDESGGDYLLVSVSLPSSSVVKRSIGVFPTFPVNSLANKEYFGPALGVALQEVVITDRELPRAWGCVTSVSLNVTVSQDSSTLVEETFPVTCTYESGQNLSKKFRGILNTTGQAPTDTSEWLDLNSNVNALWAAYDHAGLDKTTVPTSTPSASTPVEYNASDDNEAQTWGLESPSLSFVDGTIEVEIFVYNSAEDKAAETVNASIKLGGSFVTDQPLSWDTSTSGWRSAVLATGRSLSDFSGAEVRLTSPTVGLSGGKTLEAIRVKVSGDVGTGSVNVERTVDVYLTESAGDYFLTFAIKRTSDTDPGEWYIGRQSNAFLDTTALGDAGRETIGDLTGLSLPFTHDGDVNDDTGQGTEDGVITFEVANIAI